MLDKDWLYCVPPTVNIALSCASKSTLAPFSVVTVDKSNVSIFAPPCKSSLPNDA